MAASSDDNDELPSLDLFQDPAGFYPPEKPPSFTTYLMKNGRHINLRLVGHSPLWGHLLWNAGQVVAQYLEENTQQLVQGKNILELGAGAGLPSLVASLLGAKQVVVTDYPDNELIVNLRHNIDLNLAAQDMPNIVAEGFLWGSSADALTAHLEKGSSTFDVLILADILFNHSEHNKLLDTVTGCLKRTSDSVALVFFTPYRPWLLERDLNFFKMARSSGLLVDKIMEQTMDKVMFENDPGDETLRRTVFGYTVKWDL
ncbi:uncharacterized protein A1O9_08960 [Exophiala aquamarina CBS 119918]|uniref:Protein N-terminal and lysine N-methyltransferase EFM7 n=1 Tax=Exophiala aquamarina CBS 119918 TaxID=1182545 RepID=A0A072P656_9EURO|nr:uncharacterized protein A1O9_08960 [Exophiala aquamarina CBS 119918]KEF55306.1 hypothetical protein A1O9_08960 [Exophiala aquamarina CBS 119918]